MVEEGQSLVRQCLRRGRPGPYQIQAAINAVHSDAPTTGETDWAQIVALYDQLMAVTPTPVVALNRAVAVAELRGPAEALDIVDELRLDRYHLYHSVRGNLLRRLGRPDEAAAAYETALRKATTDADRTVLRRLLDG
jgi:RNA polymerase sigma-70 factor (ECF subfamily)